MVGSFFLVMFVFLSLGPFLTFCVEGRHDLKPPSRGKPVLRWLPVIIRR
jgi:hypothetical protein